MVEHSADFSIAETNEFMARTLCQFNANKIEQKFQMPSNAFCGATVGAEMGRQRPRHAEQQGRDCPGLDTAGECLASGGRGHEGDEGGLAERTRQSNRVQRTIFARRQEKSDAHDVKMSITDTSETSVKGVR